MGDKCRRSINTLLLFCNEVDKTLASAGQRLNSIIFLAVLLMGAASHPSFYPIGSTQQRPTESNPVDPDDPGMEADSRPSPPALPAGAGPADPDDPDMELRSGNAPSPLTTAYDIAEFLPDTDDTKGETARLHVIKHPWRPPTNFTWPTSVKVDAKGTKRMRRITEKHLDAYPWLAYSDSRRGYFCRFCVLFASSTVGAVKCSQKPRVLVSEPLSKFNKLTGKDGALDSHDSTKYHIESVQTALAFERSRKDIGSDIRSKLNAQWVESHNETRNCILSIAKALIFCGKQNVSLRGHRDSGRLTDTDETHEGTFRALLRFKAEDDKALQRHLEKSKANAMYISPMIQNELIEVAKGQMQQTIVRAIMDYEAGPAFTILADETSDITRREQRSLCVRHVDGQGEVKQHFLGFWDLHEETFQLDFSEVKDGEVLEPKLTGRRIGDAILQAMQDLNLDIQRCVGQGFDGAAVMSSEACGVAAVIQSVNPRAVLTHCGSHSLNLALVSASKQRSVSKMYATVREVVDFIYASPKRRALFDAAIKHACPESSRTRLKTLCETRWVERHDAISCFIELFDAVLLALSHVARWTDAKASAKGVPLLSAVRDVEFITALYCVADITSVTITLSKKLQGEKEDLSTAIGMIKDAISVLEQKRREPETAFRGTFKEVQDKLRSVGVPEDQLLRRKCGRQVHRSNVAQDAEPEVYYRVAVYIPFLDDLIAQLKSRFKKHEEMVMELGGLLPTAAQANSDTSWIRRLYDFYAPMLEGSARQTEAELLLWQEMWRRRHDAASALATFSAAIKHCNREHFPIIFQLLRYAACQPTSTPAAERSFSVLRRVKTWLRSSVGQERLTGLALMHFHPELVPSAESIVDEFLLRKPRRISHPSTSKK